PELIVLYGPNGSGKSNILRAAQLALRAAARSGDPPVKRENAALMPLHEANEKLNLRPDDFRVGDLPDIRISLEIDLGTRAEEVLRLPSKQGISRLDLEVVFQPDSEKAMRFWFERFDIDGQSIGVRPDPKDPFWVEPFPRALLPRLLQVSEAYRTPGGS